MTTDNAERVTGRKDGPWADVDENYDMVRLPCPGGFLVLDITHNGDSVSESMVFVPDDGLTGRRVKCPSPDAPDFTTGVVRRVDYGKYLGHEEHVALVHVDGGAFTSCPVRLLEVVDV